MATNDPPVSTPRLSSPQMPPGPAGWPLVGSIFRLNPKQNILFNFIDLWREFGDLCHVKLGPVHLYLVVKPEHVHHVLVGNPENYIKGNGYNGFRLLVGQGLVTSDGALWRQQRRLMQPSFTPRATAQFVDQMVAAIERVAERWQIAAQTGQPLHMDDEMAQLTMSVISQTIFGVDLGSEAAAVSQAFHEAFAFVTARTMSAFASPLAWPLPSHRRFRRNRRVIDHFVQEQITRGRQRNDQDSLLALLLQATDEETGERMRDEQVRDEVVTLFLAGFETTARSLTWGWYLLSQHPAVMTRLEAEVDAVLGQRSPTLADLAALPYTRQVVDEVLRLYPPAGLLARQVVADDLIEDYRIQGNSIVMLMPFMTHRYPGVWKNPAEFDPTRFAPACAVQRPKSAYIPFSGGARICLGNHFALTEMVFTFARLMAQFRLQRTTETPIGYGFQGSICPTAPLWMTVQPRVQ
ncbi:MAG: cytochrome P450 [Caldilineaceae bacterium]|nr:cytochrome P450 [Caldilineaceae bacterium]